MSDLMLSGTRIAVIVESQFIPEEIETYRQEFAKYGATVDLVSRLWGQERMCFYSTLEPGVIEPLQWIEVDKDFDDLDPAAYAAVIVAANYTSVRLRWSEKEVTTANAKDIARGAPAVAFVAKALRNPHTVVGASCHGLWLLAAEPGLLAGRKVICNKVVLADVLNAGAVYTPCPPGTPEDRQVVVDGDLVTSNSWHCTRELVNAVTTAILARLEDDSVSVLENAISPSANSTPVATVENIVRVLTERFQAVPQGVLESPRLVARAAGRMLDGTLDIPSEVRRLTGCDLDLTQPARHRPILLVASKFGTWASELTLVAGALLRAGYRVRVATEDGGPPHLLGPSLDPNFSDGAWRCSVVSEEERDLALSFLAPNSTEHELLEPQSIFDLRQLARPPQVGEFLRDRSTLDRYRDALGSTVSLAQDFDGLIIAGGSGAIPGLMADRGLHSLIVAFYDRGKPIMGQCNGGLALAQTVHPTTGRSILYGRAATTHSWLDEYQSGWGWVEAVADGGDFWTDGQFNLSAYARGERWESPGLSGNPLIDSEGLFRNAVGERGVFFSPPGTPYSVVVDAPLITCRTTPDGYPGVLALMALLDGRPPLRGRMFIDGETGRKTPEDLTAAGRPAENARGAVG